MRQLLAVVGLATLACANSACDPDCGGTTVGGTHFYPPGSNRDTYSLALHVSVQGLPEKAYVARTRKDIYLSLRTNDGAVLLNREYAAVAGDLEWRANWIEAERLEVAFFEFVGSDPEAARGIFTIAFESPERTGQYRETQVPAWVATTVAHELDLADQRQIFVLKLALTPDNRQATLDAVQNPAENQALTAVTIPSNWIGPLAEYRATGVSLGVTQFPDSGVLQITIEDWDRREESRAIRKSLVDLDISSTERLASATALLRGRGPKRCLEALEAVATSQGLERAEDRAPADLVTYRLPFAADPSEDAVVLTASRFASPDRIHVQIEDLGSAKKGLEVEDAVRRVLAGLDDSV